MRHIKLFANALFITALLTTGVAFAKEQSINITAVKTSDVRNLVIHENKTLSAAQPTSEQLKQLANAGVKHVINLRGENEQDWDEAQLVASLGMQYHALPIAGAQDVSVENAQKLAKIMAELNGEAVLLHCASSNRVGALMAISAHAEGLDIESALAKGKHWGMSSLEPVVRSVITAK